MFLYEERGFSSVSLVLRRASLDRMQISLILCLDFDRIGFEWNCLAYFEDENELCYNIGMNWNPLYPSDEEVSSLEEAIREAEWEDDMRQMEL